MGNVYDDDDDDDEDDDDDDDDDDEDVCMPPDNPNCQYHPHLPKFDDIKGVNRGESCEQGFRILNQYFELTRKTTQFKRNVLFWFVNECFNSDLEMELKQKKVVISKRNVPRVFGDCLESVNS